MSDIVERLRQGVDPGDITETEFAMDTGADEIERQQADIDKLLDERQGWLDENEQLREEVATMSGKDHEKIMRLQAALNALVDAHDYGHLNRGIGTSLPEGKRWLEARRALEDKT